MNLKQRIKIVDKELASPSTFSKVVLNKSSKDCNISELTTWLFSFKKALREQPKQSYYEHTY